MDTKILRLWKHKLYRLKLYENKYGSENTTLIQAIGLGLIGVGLCYLIYKHLIDMQPGSSE